MLVPDDAADTNWAQFNTSALTAKWTITVPDQSLELVGTESNQVIKNKAYETVVLQDPTDNAKKITFNVSNQTTVSNSTFVFPETNTLNSGGGDNTLVSELASQDLSNKSLVTPVLKDSGNTVGQVALSVDNITGPRTIRFPDSIATLLSTDNVTLEDVNFGAGIGANNLTGKQDNNNSSTLDSSNKWQDKDFLDKQNQREQPILFCMLLLSTPQRVQS